MTENNKYIVPENSNTIKKLKMFNYDIFIPKKEDKSNKLQEISNKMNINRAIELKKDQIFTKLNSGEDTKEGALKTIEQTKIIINGEEKTYLRMDREENDNLFISRFFNFMGYPTFNTYISSDNNRPLFEKLEGTNKTKLEDHYNNEKRAEQFIKRNIVTNFFNDYDAHLENVMYNKDTEELKIIDLNIRNPNDFFTIEQIMTGVVDTINLNYYLLDISKNLTDKYKNLHENKKFIDYVNNKKNSTFSIEPDDFNNKYCDIIQKEYFNLQRKLFLINDEDLDFITYANNNELNKNENFVKDANKFKNIIKLHQVKSFYWMYNQDNLHKLFGLEKGKEAELKNLFNINSFENNTKYSNENISCDINSDDENQFPIFLASLSKTPEFKNFMLLMELFSKKNKEENYKNIDSLFNSNKETLESSLKNNKTLNNFIENFSNGLKLKDNLSIEDKNNFLKKDIIDYNQHLNLYVDFITSNRDENIDYINNIFLKINEDKKNDNIKTIKDDFFKNLNKEECESLTYKIFDKAIEKENIQILNQLFKNKDIEVNSENEDKIINIISKSFNKELLNNLISKSNKDEKNIVNKIFDKAIENKNPSTINKLIIDYNIEISSENKDKIIDIITIKDKQDLTITLIKEETKKGNKEDTIKKIFDKAIENNSINIINDLIKNNNIEINSENKDKIINVIIAKDNTYSITIFLKKIKEEDRKDTINKIFDEAIKNNKTAILTKLIKENFNEINIESKDNIEEINKIFDIAYKNNYSNLIDKMLSNEKLRESININDKIIDNHSLTYDAINNDNKNNIAEILIKHNAKFRIDEKNEISEKFINTIKNMAKKYKIDVEKVKNMEIIETKIKNIKDSQNKNFNINDKEFKEINDLLSSIGKKIKSSEIQI